MSAIGRGRYFLECNSTITNSSITSTTITTSAITASTIDMNGGVITSAGLPTNYSDVVNKQYVDNAIAAAIAGGGGGGGVTPITVTLSGTAYTTISSATRGQARISVKNLITSGPSGSWEIVKSEPSMNPEITRLSLCAGQTTGEKLELEWPVSGALQLHKTGVNYDGTYQVVVYMNSN